MVWRIMGLRHRIKFKDETAASAWLEWGEQNVKTASSTELANVAGSMRHSGCLNTAQQALDQAFLKGESARAWFEKASLLVANKGNLQLGEAQYHKAIDLDPTDALPWSNLGWVLHHSKRLDEAESAYRKAIELDPNYAMPWNNLGNVLRDEQRLNEAERTYRKAIELDPTNAIPWSNLGVLLGQLNRLDEAVMTLRTARGLDNNWHSYWLGKLVDFQTQIFTKKALEALYDGQETVLRDLLLGLQNESADLSMVFASAHFVEAFLAPVLKQPQHAELVLGLLREMNAEKFARPLLIAFEAAVSNRPAMLAELEPELQRATKKMFDRLMANGISV